MGSVLKFLTCYAQERDEFLDSIVTGDETWGFHHTPEFKRQSLQRCHTIPPEPKNSKLQSQWKKSWRLFSGTEKAFSWSTSWILAKQLMLLHIVTRWTALMNHSEQMKGNVVMQCVPAPQQCAAPFCTCHHCASGKIHVGYIGQSAVQSWPCARRFPLISSPKETSPWEKVRRQWWGGSKGRRQTSMTRRYRSWFQDLINV